MQTDFCRKLRILHFSGEIYDTLVTSKIHSLWKLSCTADAYTTLVDKTSVLIVLKQYSSKSTIENLVWIPTSTCVWKVTHRKTVMMILIVVTNIISERCYRPLQCSIRLAVVIVMLLQLYTRCHSNICRDENAPNDHWFCE